MRQGQPESNVAVLIDYENVGLDAIQYLLDQLSDVGRVIIKRAYADWSLQRGKQDQLLELGIEPIHHYRSSKSGKNSSDICLAIDAMDLLYQSPVDTFVIVSSDSDFVPLVSKLRAAGKAIIGSGRREVTSPTLVKSCDRYIYLDDANKTSAKIAQQRRRRQPSRSPDGDVESLVIRAMHASMDDQGQVVGSKLHQAMQRIDPSFNFRTLGFGYFRQFLSTLKSVKVDQPKEASDVIVRLNHGRDNGQVQDNGHVKDEAHGREAVVESAAWDREIDAAWSARQRKVLSGRAAADDAAKVLGVPKLSASKYPSLDKLLAASDYLSARWRRDGNTVQRK